MSRALWLTMLVLAAAAMLLSGYLTYASMLGSGPLGCGGGSGCGEVLASKWSKVMGLPVSGLAVVAYLGVLASLLGVRAGAAPVRGASWAVLVGLAALIAASAAWFIYVQLAVLDSVCPYCMVDHAIGLVLATFVFAAAPKRPVLAMAAGFVAVVAVATLQWSTPATVHRAAGVGVAGDTDAVEGNRRRVELLGGTLAFDLRTEPHLGSADAERIVVLLFDYACPHCRQTHGVMREYLASGASPPFVMVAIPVPVHRNCNPFALDEMPSRFDESCELARIALAVHAADAARFETFDTWMFEPELPRAAADARAKAIELVGREAFEAAYGSERIASLIDRNVAAYEKLGDDRRVPAVLLPGQEPIIGPVEDAAALAGLFAEAAAVP